MTKKETKKEEKKESKFNFKGGFANILTGFIIGIIVILLLEQIPAIGNLFVSGGKIATSKAGKVTRNALFTEMKKNYPVSYILELVDGPILAKKYKLTDEQEKEIIEKVDKIVNQYKDYYGMTEEEFYEENGFTDREDFINYMKLDYRRNLYCLEYFKGQLGEDKIKEYYENGEIFGEIKTKHMLVQITDDVKDADALKIANELIKALNEGKSFDDVAKEYGDKIVSEEVTFDSFEAEQYDTNYVNASKALEVGKYTNTPIKSSYGYHVIYCVSKADKPAYEDVENDIIVFRSRSPLSVLVMVLPDILPVSHALWRIRFLILCCSRYIHRR